MRTLGLALVFAALLPGSTIYTVVDLGGLGGSNSNGFQINDAGAVVGWADTITGAQQAFLSSSGAPAQALPSSGASDSYAYGINDADVIVGTAYVNGEVHGVIWAGAASKDLGAGIFATAINASGVIAGSNGHAFRLVNGTYQDLGVLAGGDWSAAYSLNDAGTAAGCGDLASGLMRAVVWNADGSSMQLGTLGGANSYAAAINNNGTVVGHSGTASGYEHAFVEANGAMHDLGTLNGGSSYAYGINDSGSIVGYSWSDIEDNPRAFLYSDGGMQDLNALIGGAAGWQLLEAYGINASGEIAGVGLHNGKSTAFLLEPDPVPEPRGLSVILFTLGLFAVFLRQLRMRYRS
ncbi:MAG TPA: hypothetical protein VKX49_32370 [Bryobacteraceae bacterium]|nr:hypothetical protein [Bryobacteraceae bacterium]